MSYLGMLAFSYPTVTFLHAPRGWILVMRDSTRHTVCDDEQFRRAYIAKEFAAIYGRE